MTVPNHSDLQRDLGRMEGRFAAVEDRLEKIDVVLERIDARLARIEATESQRKGALRLANWIWGLAVTAASTVGGAFLGHFWK